SYLLHARLDFIAARNRELPLPVRRNRALTSRSLDLVALDQNLAGRDEEVAVAQRLENRAPVFLGARHSVELQIVDGKIRVEIVLGSFLAGVDVGADVLRTQ